MRQPFDIFAPLRAFGRHLLRLPVLSLSGRRQPDRPFRRRRAAAVRPLAFMALLFAASLMMGGAAPAFAVTYSFTQLNSNAADPVSDQLSADVLDSGNGTVSFTFYNAVGEPSSITDVYLTGTGDLLVLPGSITDQSAGVSYDTGANPANLPVGSQYDFYATVGADSNPPTKPNGVDKAGEYVTWTFSLANGMTYQDVISAIDSGTLQIGMLVPGSSGGSSSFLNSCALESCLGPSPSAQAVPLPASFWLMCGALGGLGVLSRRGGPRRQGRGRGSQSPLQA